MPDRKQLNTRLQHERMTHGEGCKWARLLHQTFDMVSSSLFAHEWQVNSVGKGSELGEDGGTGVTIADEQDSWLDHSPDRHFTCAHYRPR